MQDMRTLVLAFLFLSALVSCNQKSEVPDISSLDARTEIGRFEKAFFECPRHKVDSCLAFLKTDFEPFFMLGDSFFWQLQRNDSLINSLKRDVDSKSKELDIAVSECIEVMKYYRYYFPESKDLKLYTYISPNDVNYPIIFTDTVAFIALDQYLGRNSPFYAPWPDYFIYRKEPIFLSADLADQIALHFIKSPETLSDFLSDMILEGKRLYFASKLLPSKEERHLLRYSKESWDFCIAHEREIWKYFLEQKALFSSSLDLKRRFIFPAPFSKFYLPIDNESPGQVGRWIGYQLVKKAVEKNNLTLKELLAIQDANWFLKNAKYHP